MEDIDVNNYIEVNLFPDVVIKTEIEIKEEPLDESPDETLRYFQCNKCDYKTKRRYEMKNHIAANHFGMRFKCDQCDYEGKRKDKLTNHLKTKHPDTGMVAHFKQTPRSVGHKVQASNADLLDFVK